MLFIECTVTYNFLTIYRLSTPDQKEIQKCKKVADTKRKLLMQLLQKPLFPKGFSGKYFTSGEQVQHSNVQEKAVDVMQSILQKTSKGKRKLSK